MKECLDTLQTFKDCESDYSLPEVNEEEFNALIDRTDKSKKQVETVKFDFTINPITEKIEKIHKHTNSDENVVTVSARQVEASPRIITPRIIKSSDRLSNYLSS